MAKEYFVGSSPSMSSDLLWTLLSVMTESIENQVILIGVEKKISDETGNIFSGLYFYICALSRYIYSWADEFEFMLSDENNPTWQEKLETALAEISSLEPSTECFKDALEWKKFRILASDLLAIAELPLAIPLSPLNYDDFMRVIIDDKGFFVGLD